MTPLADTVRARSGVALFEMDERGLLEVRGADRIRWLDGMITQNVKRLEERGEGAGCHALLLTHRGAIVADLHVGLLGEGLVLEVARQALPRVRAVLEKMIIADDVALAEPGDALAAIGIEGARAGDVLARALAGTGAPLPEADAWAEVELAGARARIGAFGWTGERAYQLWVALAARGAVRRALEAAAADVGVECVVGDRALLETLRIESGIPALGAELDEDVLPPEARLEPAIAKDKGCYVGQEIVARLRSRGQVNHLLVGLRFEGDVLPEVGTALSVAGRPTGEITSAVRSPSAGPIALAYVRREHAEVGTAIEVATGATARVAALPFVPPASAPLR